MTSLGILLVVEKFGCAKGQFGKIGGFSRGQILSYAFSKERF